MFKDKPNEYVRAVLSILPKELQVESITAEMSIEDVDNLIVKVRDNLTHPTEAATISEAADDTVH